MTGQMHLYLLLVAPLAPLAGAIVAGLFGTGFIGKPIHPRISRFVTIFAVSLSFLSSLYALYGTTHHMTFNQGVYSWMASETFRAEIGFMVDSLTALMMCVVSFISLVVHVYSVGYMKEDPGNSRFFACIAFFTFSMLMLVMANNFLQLFFGWEAVGLASYLLIGFWYEKPRAATAGIKAFLINRISDAFFITGVALLFSAANSFYFTDIFAMRQSLSRAVMPETGWHLVTVSCLCIFIGAMGKSAQFPFHLWLPDSMEGPTPVSALIHAATMVTAGIFIVARLSPLYELSETALSLMLVIGGFTALFMGLVAMVQNDIKQVIAYSTISQLGYMTLALGASAYSAAIFHLMTHAFFKALLFLAAGVVILGMNHDQDIRNMGGLKKYMPVTWVTAWIASLSLAGIPFFSGFYSKDSILVALSQNHSLAGAAFARVAAYLGIFVTAFYTFRLLFLVFHGESRFGTIPPAMQTDHEEVVSHEPIGILPGETPHKVPKIMTVPLIILAVPSFLIGGLTLKPLLSSPFFADAILTDTLLHPAMQKLEGMARHPFSMALHGFLSLSFLLLIAGMGAAFYCYRVKPQLPNVLAKRFSALYQLWLNQYYLSFMGKKCLDMGERLLGRVFVFGRLSGFIEKWVTQLAVMLGRGFWKLGEIRLIDGLIVNGTVRLMACFSQIIRHFQSGYLYHYAFVMVLSLLCFLLYFCR